MSWLFPTSHQPDDDDVDPNDLSFLGQTLTRQLRGVATFLAPPPPPPSSSVYDAEAAPSPTSQPSPVLLGVRNDLAEFGGSFKTGLSLLSLNKISKFASNLLQLRSESSTGADDDDDVDGAAGGFAPPGISDETLGFVTEISKLPNYWTEFPLPLDQDFCMSDAQREHAFAVEQLISGIADLRVKIGSSMSEERFWMIYFLLLLPRLNEDDFELLSNPEIVEARDALLQKLQKNSIQMDPAEESSLHSTQKDIQLQKTRGEEISSPVNKDLIGEIVDTADRLKIDDEESIEHWSEEASISSGTFVDDRRKIEHEEYMSFSELEDSENDISSRSSVPRPAAQDFRAGSPNGSNDWVQLNRSTEFDGGQRRVGTSREKDSEGEESNDWLTVDEFD